jgi:dTDP-4-amino-4,6-dideoxygalactose transaminase
MAGATPVFVDVEPGTFNLDPARVERAITPRTRAIVPVHLYGQVAAMDVLGDLARARGLVIVADAAQAVGASYAGRPVAAWADATTLSFYPTKNLGACAQRSADHARRRGRARQDIEITARPAGTHIRLGGAAGSTSCRRRCSG